MVDLMVHDQSSIVYNVDLLCMATNPAMFFLHNIYQPGACRHRPVHTWFLEIDLVREVCVCVCVHP